MRRKSAVKGEGPRMRKLVVRVPEELVRALKVRAAQADTSMAAFVADLLRRELTEKGGKKG
jgi:plasmid stability protein